MINNLYEFDKEFGTVIGVDEAGRGPLAGPVVASAVLLKKYSPELDAINDSKKLTEKKREALFPIIMEHFYVGVGIATHDEIDEINILNATFLAMRRAIKNINLVNGDDLMVLVDGSMRIRKYSGVQMNIVKGDSKSLSIAAASIIAKVSRDRQMVAYDEYFPQYSFSKHKGYGTKLHREMIKKYGICEIHRKSFLTKILASDKNE